MQATVRDAISTDVVTVPSSTSIDDAERLLVRYGLPELFVTNEQGHLQGILPDYALLKHRMAKLSHPERTVESLMSRRFLVIGADSPLSVAARYLREHVHVRLAVVDRMRLIGKVTRASVLQILSANPSVTQGHDGHHLPKSLSVRQPKRICSGTAHQPVMIR